MRALPFDRKDLAHVRNPLLIPSRHDFFYEEKTILIIFNLCRGEYDISDVDYNINVLVGTQCENFSVIQILREINFGKFRRSKTAVFAIFVALNFVNLANFRLQKGQNFIKSKI